MGEIDPKFRQVGDLMLVEIARLGLRDGDRIPSRPFWRKELGVANDTIDRALKELIQQGVLTARLGSGTFLANRAEVERRSGRRLTLTVLIPRTREQMLASPSAHVFLRRLEGIARGCAARNVVTSLRFIDPYEFASGEELANAIGTFGEGAVIFQEPMAARLEGTLRARGVPFMVLGVTPRQCNVVDVELRPAYRQVFEHLKKIGRTRVAYLSDDPESPNAHLGQLADVQAESGLRFEKVLWPDVRQPEQVVRAVEKEICGSGINAVLARNDERALLAMAALQRRGVSVPEDAVVIGFDDSGAAEASSPPLATVRNPLEECGEAAVARVLEMIRARSLDCDRTWVEASFVLRASATPAGLAQVPEAVHTEEVER